MSLTSSIAGIYISVIDLAFLVIKIVDCSMLNKTYSVKLQRRIQGLYTFHILSFQVLD